MKTHLVFLFLLLSTRLPAQILFFPHYERFDSAVPPLLPAGWLTSANRSLNGDFITTKSTSRSDSNAVISTNSTIEQFLVTPIINFADKDVDTLQFYERRSSSHTSGVLIEASVDGGISFSTKIGDTLKNPGTSSYVLRKLPLSSVLSNQPNVRLRWRVVGNGTGTTGTIRIDDVTITARARFDLSMSGITFSPRFPIIGDSVDIRATVKNTGTTSLANFIVEFYADRDGDSLGQPEELFHTATVTDTLASLDSLMVSAEIHNISFSDELIIARVVHAIDQNPFNDTVSELLAVGLPRGSVIINEIMYQPNSPEPEWIEFTTTLDSVNLKDWKISDRNTRTQYRLTPSNFLLRANEYLAVTKDSLNFSTRYPDIHRFIAVPSLPASLFNNDSDAVVLFDHRGAIMDSVPYSSRWGGTHGRSLERKETHHSSADPGAWGTSINPDSSTPTRKNSLTKKDFDLRIVGIDAAPPAPVNGDDVTLRFTIKNIGKFATGTYTFESFEDINGDSNFTAAELLMRRESLDPISPDDSANIKITRPLLPFGEHRFLGRIALIEDEDTSNDRLIAAVIAGYQPGSIVINEIVYAPTTGQPEWIELYNTTSSSIDLQSWKISNRNSASRYFISDSTLALPPLWYCVVTKDTALFHQSYPDIDGLVIESPSLPTFLLNNSGDAVVLFDTRGAIMDSVRFDALWGGQGGKSLERIEYQALSTDSTNWGTSLDSMGSTPTRQNFLTPLEYNLRVKRISLSNASPSNADIDISIQNIGRIPLLASAVALYHDANGDSIAGSSEIIDTQYLDEEILPKDSLNIGIHWSNPGSGRKAIIASISSELDMRASDNVFIADFDIPFTASSIVITEIMYEPRTGDPEYIELFNRSASPVDIAGWTIQDSDTSKRFVMSHLSLVIGGGEYLMVGLRTHELGTFASLLDTTDRAVLLLPSGPSLNNDGDDIILRDLTGATIDSVHYNDNWHNSNVEETNGRSLERINPHLPSNDKRNWSTSAHPLGGTPGRQNSIFTTSPATSTSASFSPNPFSPDGDGFEDVTILKYSLRASSTIIRARIYDAKGRLIRILADGEPSGQHGEIIWDGFGDDKNRVPVGIYITLLESLHADGNTLETKKIPVVIATKLR